MTALEMFSVDEALLVSLAREIAGDLRPLEDVLATYAVSNDSFETIRHLPRFIRLLEIHKTEWDAAGNTYERTKLKSAILIENWLVEANTLLHSTNTLASKTELAKLVAKLAGMGLERADLTGGAGEKLTININLGSDHKLKFEMPPKVIDAEAN